METGPSGRGPGRELSPVAIATRLESLADSLASSVPKSVVPELRHDLQASVDGILDICSSIRGLALIFDAQRADLLAKRETEFKSILTNVGESMSDLSGASDKLADKVGSQISELDALAELPPDADVAHRARGTLLQVREATSEVHSRIELMSASVAKANERIKVLERELTEALRKALYDSLTHVHSRAALDEALGEAVREGNAKGPWCFLLADVDHFKKVNDRYGHVVGDALLFKIARVIESSLRSCGQDGLVGRYGGEEFGIILHGMASEQAGRVADQIRESMATSSWKYRDHHENPVLRATVSIGVTPYRANDRVAELVRRADQALYAAKEQGRNRVVVAKT